MTVCLLVQEEILHSFYNVSPQPLLWVISHFEMVFELYPFIPPFISQFPQKAQISITMEILTTSQHQAER